MTSVINSAAVDLCVKDGRSMAGLFRKYYADLLIEECAKIVDTAVDHRIPASQYGDLIRKLKGS